MNVRLQIGANADHVRFATSLSELLREPVKNSALSIAEKFQRQTPIFGSLAIRYLEYCRCAK